MSRIIFFSLSFLFIINKANSQTFRGAYDVLENQIYETYLSQLTQPSPHDFSVATQVASDSIGVTKEKKWSWEICAAANYCYRKIDSEKISITEQPTYANWRTITYKSKFDIPKMGFAAGVNVSRSSKNKFRYAIGIHFKNYGYKTETIDTLFVHTNYGAGFVIRDTCINCGKITFNDYLLSFPVMLEYIFYKSRKFQLLIGTGMSTDFLLREVEKRDKRYNTLSGGPYFSIMANSEISWLQGNNLYSIGPLFNYLLVPITQRLEGYNNSPFFQKKPIGSRNLYAVGIAVKIKIKQNEK